MSSESAITRREFAASAVLVALTTACSRAGTGVSTSATATAAPPAAGAVAPGANAMTPQADALMRIVEARYGEFIPANVRTEVRDSIARNLRLGDRLASAPVTNADGPFTVCLGPVEER